MLIASGKDLKNEQIFCFSCSVTEQYAPWIQATHYSVARNLDKKFQFEIWKFEIQSITAMENVKKQLEINHIKHQLYIFLTTQMVDPYQTG